MYGISYVYLSRFMYVFRGDETAFDQQTDINGHKKKYNV